MSAMSTAWWLDFFSGAWLDVQRQFKPPEQTQAEADFIQDVMQLAPGARVLDAPCGEGRLSLELAARGCVVTGVDITPALLEDARRQAAERGLDVRWVQRDMRDLPWQGEFDAAFCYWGSFGYFDEAGNRDFVQAVGRALRSGGRFLIDTHCAETLFPILQERGWWEMGDTTVLEWRRYDHETGRIDVEWTFVQNGQTTKRFSSIRLYTYRELCTLLRQAGFATFTGYSAINKNPFEFGARRLILLATKP